MQRLSQENLKNLNQENYKAPYHEQDSFKNKKGLGQDNSNKKHLQNYLNQNLSQSDINGEGVGNNSSMMRSGVPVGAGMVSSALNQANNANASRLNKSSADQTPFQGFNDNSFISLSKNDPRKNDRNYACLIIRKMEFFCSKVNLEKHSNYLFRVFDRQEQSFIEAQRNAQIRIKLPDNTKPDILIMFIDYIDKGKEFPNKIDLYIAQNVVTIAEALKMRQIQKKFLMEIIMPMLNRENVIFFIKMSYHKLSDGRDQQEDDAAKEVDADLESVTTHKEEEDFWLEFLSYTLDLAAANIQYLIKKKSTELHGVLEPNIIDEIIERAIKFYRADLQYDSTLLFETLMKVRNCDSIFQLLDQEKSKIIENEEQILKSGVRPILTWKVQNLSGNFYRESDGFWVENAQWKLAISYFSNDEDALSVSLKMISNPFDVKNSKDYFKKKEFFLPSNVGVYNQNPIDEYEEYDIKDKDEIMQRRKQIEKANSEYPSHSYITMVSAVRIHSNDELKEPLIQSLICSAKSPALLKKFDGFYPEDYDGEVTIEIYFKLKYIYSAILLYITRNFTYQITDPIIYLLPKDQYKLILKHKLLNVTQEDEVIKSLCLWMEGQEPRESLEIELKELLENVQWNYVSIPCFLDLIRNFSLLRRHESFKKIVHKEFNIRLKFNPETTNLDPPRNCYKYNKTQTNPESITKNLKNAKALLFINHEDFFTKFLDQLLEPVDVIRTHLVNEGVSESSHRKFLELQLQQKQKELIDIQMQLNNMKLLDDLDNSRSNSRLQRRNSSRQQYNQSRQNGRSSIDEQETVKNSMINLLHVIDGSAQPAQQTNGNHLRNISNEIVQQMQFNANEQVESPFEVYENQVQPGKQNQVQILFQSLTEDLRDQDENEQTVKFNNGIDPGNTNYQRQGDDDQEDMDEEEKEEFNVHNQILNDRSNSPELNFNPSLVNQQLKQQLQLQQQQQQHFHLRNNDDLASFNCNSFVVGGAALNRQEEVQVHENKEIQTSLNFIITSHLKSRVSNTQLSHNSSRQFMDQGIQMSNASVGIDFKDILQDESIRKSDVIVHSNIKEYVNQSIQFELIQQDQDEDEEIKLDVVNIGLKTENCSNSRSSELNIELSNNSNNQQQSSETHELKVKRTIKFDENIASLPSETIKTKQHQPNQRPKQANQEQNRNILNNDQQYQKSIQEYMQFVQQLSKDEFDKNFLEQILGPSDFSTHNVFTFQNQDLQTVQNKRTNNLQVSQSHQKQLDERIAKHILQSDKSSAFNGNNNPISTQAYTPMSNNNQSMMASFFNNQNNTNLNTLVNYSSSIGSNFNLSGKNFKTPSSAKGGMTLTQMNHTNMEAARGAANHQQYLNLQPRAKSQNNNYRGQKIHQKRATNAQKLNVQSNKNVNLNRTENQIRQTHKSMNSSITRNKSSISNSHSNTGLQSAKNSQLAKFTSNSNNQFSLRNRNLENSNSSALKTNIKQINKQGMVVSNQTQQIKGGNTINGGNNNQKVVSLQKLLENTANLSQMDNDLCLMPQNLLAWTGNSDNQNFQSQLQPQNLFASTLIPDNINLPFDITAQIANFNILDHIQVKPSGNNASGYNKQIIKGKNIPSLSSNANNSRLLSNGQSPSSNYHSKNGNPVYDFQRANATIKNPQIRLGTIEESKMSELLHNANNEDRSTAHFNQLNGTQNLIRNIGNNTISLNLMGHQQISSATNSSHQVINLDHQNERGGSVS